MFARLSVALLLLIATSCGPRPCRAQQNSRGANALAPDLRSAGALVRNRQFPAAVAAYQKILRAEPHNEKAELGLAAAYYGVYNYDQMRRLLRETAAIHPKSAAALVELGKLDIHLLHYDDAILELTPAVRREPGSAAAHEQLGVAYQAKGDNEKALVEFNEAVRLAPDSASPHYFRGSLYADRNDPDRAYQDANAAYRAQANTQTRELLAKAALSAGKCDESIDLLQPLAQSEDAVPEDIYLLSRAYKCAGQTQRAKEMQDEYEKRSQTLQDAKTRKMHADHLAVNAGELARKNQLAAALAVLGQALEEDPENGPSLAQLAKIDFSRGDVAKAQEEIAKALRGDPYNPDYLYVRGKVLESSDPAAALEAFQQTVLVDPKESDAYFEIGEVYLRMGERNRAAEALRRAVQLSPDDPDYKKALAEVSGKHSR
jgi:tetratricopeptide (TPR) repeat protein